MSRPDPLIVNPVVYEYDSHGRLSRVIEGPPVNPADPYDIDMGDQSTRITSFSYYSDTGFLESITNAENQAIYFEHDPVGRIKKEIMPGPGSPEINYSYDLNGNLKSLTPPAKPAHLFDYNQVDLMKEYEPPFPDPTPTPPAGTFNTLFEYYLDRQTKSITRPGSRTINFEYYTDTGKLKSIDIFRGQINYLYTTGGNLEKITDPDGNELEFTYDGSLLLYSTWKWGTIEKTLSQGFDDDYFRITSHTVDGFQIDYVYDDDGLLKSTEDLIITRNTATGFIDGTVLEGPTPSQNITDNYTYNDFGEIIGYNSSCGTSNLYSTTFTRDKLGRIATKTESVLGEPSEIYTYGYDDIGRLEEVKLGDPPVTISSYIYDDNGNRLSRSGVGPTITGTYDNQDRLINYGSIAYTYTDNGELETKDDSGDITRYTYDELGNLISVILHEGTTSEKEISYIIDGLNRRVGRIVDGSVVTNRYLYMDGVNPIAELNAIGDITCLFIYGTKMNVPDYMIKNPGDLDETTYRLISDHLGSPRLVVNLETSEIVQQIEYDAFGHPTFVVGNAEFHPFGFAGGLYDSETGLVRFGVRDYDSITGRWTAKDPILFAGGDTNLYEYCLNDPVNFIDSFGLILWYANKAAEIAMKPHIKKIMTTKWGNILLAKLHSNPKIFYIHACSSPSGRGGSTIDNNVYVDPNYHPTFKTVNHGIQTASTTRVLAHELGHLTGIISESANIKTWENPIMTPIDGFVRYTRY